MSSMQCSICLKFNHSVSVGECDEKNINWYLKLQAITPELEWAAVYTICETCRHQLDGAYAFRKLCIALEPQRRALKLDGPHNDVYLKREFEEHETITNGAVSCCDNVSEITSDDKSNLTDSIPYSNADEFICFHCEKAFTSKPVLAQHIRLKHDVQNPSGKTCSECNNFYINRTVLEDHMRKCHGIGTTELTRRNKEYECHKCGKLYTREKVMKNHLISCDGVRRHSKNGTTEFKCNHCTRYYTTEKILKAHLKVCNLEDKPETGTIHSCQVCGKTFDELMQFKAHLKDDHNAKLEYLCDACGKDCGTPKEFKRHMTDEHLDGKEKYVKKRKGRQSHRTFSCEVCKEVFVYVKVLVQHCTTIHAMDAKTVKPYSCEDCDNRFSSSANLIQHKKYHDGSRTHICSFCGKSFITKSDLTSHEYTHYNRRNYKCETCDKAFNTNKNLRTHKLVVHTDASLWKYCCIYCQKRFPMKTGFNQHMRRHTGDKQFSCHICGKSFISKSEMQKHMRLHSNIRDFKCGKCGKEYKDRKVFEIHLARVHGIGDAKVPVRVKKFVCHICPNTFYDRQKLTRHLCTHTGLKPFECPACEKKFTDKSYLKHHLKVAHNVFDPLKYD